MARSGAGAPSSALEATIAEFRDRAATYRDQAAKATTDEVGIRLLGEAEAWDWSADNLESRADQPSSSEPSSGSEDCESCDDTGIYREGAEWAPCESCERGRDFAECLRAARAEWPIKGLDLTSAEMRHLLERCTESTNAPKVNGYSCETCRSIGANLEAALADQPSETTEEGSE